MNDMADDTWDNKAMNRTSAIHFLDDDDDDEDDEKVRAAILKTQRGVDFGFFLLSTNPDEKTYLETQQ